MPSRALATATITASVIALGMATTGAADAAPGQSPQPLARTSPAWIAHAKHLGRVADSAAVKARVYLAPRGGLTAAQQFATALSTPGSAQYGKFLTHAQYESRFAPSRRQVEAVSSYLRSSGLRVGSTGAGNRYIIVSGTARSASAAFGARIDRYVHAGRTVQAPSSVLTLPSSLRSAVLTVSGLDTSPLRARPASPARSVPAVAPLPPPGARNAKPCSAFFGQLDATYKADFKAKLPQFQGKTLSYLPCGYTGPLLRSAYENSSALDGTGVKVGVVDAYASPTLKADANRYAEEHGDGSYAAGQYYRTVATPARNETECGASGWYSEQTLDVEAVHAMAPGARIHYYGARSCDLFDFLDTLTRVVDDNDVSLVSNSWGSTETSQTSDVIAAYQAVFVQGAIQGQGFLFSSGDDGDELAATGLKQADYPTSDPNVTSVGGTSDAIGPDAKFAFQTGWGTQTYSLSGTTWQPQGFLYGAGGGVSNLFNRPGYQNSVTQKPFRQIPDVAMDADPNTGMLIGQTQTFTDGVHYGEYRLGGTSLASPLFAGITALKQQARGKRIGQLNPTIYSSTTAFRDIQGSPPVAGVVRADYKNGVDAADGLKYAVRVFNRDSSLKVAKGYDQVTGVGAPKAAWFGGK